jgi:hypothetical protein
MRLTWLTWIAFFGLACALENGDGDGASEPAPNGKADSTGDEEEAAIPDPEALVGSYRASGEGQPIELLVLRRDGGAIIERADDAEPVRALHSADGSELVVVVGDGGDVRARYRLEGDSLELSVDDGSVLELSRVPPFCQFDNDCDEQVAPPEGASWTCYANSCTPADPLDI